MASPADREKTMAYQIFRRHNQREEAGQLHLKFDSLISHDITYVGIIQTAKASGLKEFPLPYVMTNCHNTCAPWGAPSTRTTMSSACPPPSSMAATSSPPTRRSSTSTPGR
ncbi:MAG: hypothetical protein ACLT9P_07525 [Evtepia gabavorous]